ncbi:type I-C CRISPR-associated protein Cas5c [Actinoallomurus sp. NPDC052308]|uniref:type I-C CRISPR-associated protein Cas5c n=1 Tax=Actinoallomurus sp. NPDC052308 TaxID=3155530 RepID=UPI003416A5AF
MSRTEHPWYRHGPVVVEVAGPYACFTRPELKTERFSYEVMTPSAAKGVLEAIYWKPEFDYIITQIDVLAPIRWTSIRRNEVGSMLTVDWIRKAMTDPSLRYDVENDRDQRNTVFLRDVAYRIHAQIRLRSHAKDPEAKYRHQLRRRVDRGRCFSQPFLGTRECSASFGPATDRDTITDDKDLGVMLHSIHYSPAGETYRWFHAELKHGVMGVPPHGAELPTAGPAAARR